MKMNKIILGVAFMTSIAFMSSCSKNAENAEKSPRLATSYPR